ncbi:MAG: bifunctional proline dehydrogenase/L-glutamate gamma-semialdehyde dehydrogenase PutA [Pseudomonadota bacterium]
MTHAPPLSGFRAPIAALHTVPDATALAPLIAAHAPDGPARARAVDEAVALVRAIRADSRPGLMEVFLAEYGLSTDEGVALMCLAEALLRVPDAPTMDELIEDKIAPSRWGAHLGHSSSTLVNASTWALMLTGHVLKHDAEPGIAATLRGAVRRLGEPVIRRAAAAAMREMGNQFVLGETIRAAVMRGRAIVDKGYSYSYDMLGEAARTAADAEAYLGAYHNAIATLAAECTSADIALNPGISIKLSALHPRYEEPQRARVMSELVPRVLGLAQAARAAAMGLNIDAEEADRLDLSLDVIEAVLASDSLAGWDGFGVVVQAYGKRAAPVIDWLQALAMRLDRRIMVRLVKGAYWDTEIKLAQELGVDDFPVFTRKANTDLSFIACAAKLLAADRIYPQFATHNAHSAAAILQMGADPSAFEFQRLHGMGEALHDLLKSRHGTRCRIYAPVGAHRDLLAYLVRRLLENGANSSFVNRIVDPRVPAEEVVPCPFAEWETVADQPAPGVTSPNELWGSDRPNARGWDLHDPATLAALDEARAPFAEANWTAAPLLASGLLETGPDVHATVINPARPRETVGTARFATPAEATAAIGAAQSWSAPAAERAAILRHAADLYEAHHGEIFSLLAREAGKTLPDAVSELREAVDFLRYYAGFATDAPPRGTICCISPWNFPLAIFTGQIAAALAAGNAVLAKPAEATSLVAVRAAALLHKAGVPPTALQLLPGLGRTLGPVLTADPRVAGVCFTGSTATAQAIHRSMAGRLPATAPLIAETGGLNAMIVDSSALPEQAVRDIVASGFQSAGQRCSALRMLYIQEDVADRVLTMLKGAMDELSPADPWDQSSDLGPIISAEARNVIVDHIARAEGEGRLIHQITAPGEGHFVGPALIRVRGIEALDREIFGPVIHVATFQADAIDRVVDAINAKGFGLTFGLHTRIDDRVERIAARLRVGNLYVNRNQIGAIVGSQPFGGEGLSGTGPKAGGPAYVARFRAPAKAALSDASALPAKPVSAAAAQSAIDAAPTDTLATLSTTLLPGPTGESNRLTSHPRGTVLCLGPGVEAARAQARAAQSSGCATVVITPGWTGPGGHDGTLLAETLRQLHDVALVAFDGSESDGKAYRTALAARDGAIVPLVTAAEVPDVARLERHLCIDTTASGGNASLLAAASGADTGNRHAAE